MGGGGSFLDGVGARILAAVICLAAAGGIALYHRDVLLADRVALPRTGNPELDACIAERAGQADALVADGLLEPAEADTFRERAVAFCEQTVGR